MDYKKFIDSVVGNIARKIEDEFNENDHPRDKGGKFTSKGGEGKGGAKEESNVKSVKHGKYNIKVHKHGDDKYSYYSYENDKDGSITYASGNASSEEEALKKAKNKLDEHDKRYGTIPETETEKAAKKELSESSGNNKKLASKLKEIASDGFSEYPEMAQDFLKTMGVKLPKLSREEKEYYEEYPEEYQDLIMEKVNATIERDPEKAQEALGEWASDISEEDE